MDIRKIDKAIRLNRELQPIARALHHLDEASCNYGLTNKQKKRLENLEKKADKLAREWFGLRAYHQSDPRGASLYLVESLRKANRGNYADGVYIY